MVKVLRLLIARFPQCLVNFRKIFALQESIRIKNVVHSLFDGLGTKIKFIVNLNKLHFI